MKTACLPSGDVTEGTAAAPRPPRPPRPRPAPPRPPSAEAAHAGSAHGCFCPVAGSTMIVSLPAGVVIRYQNRSSGSQVGLMFDRYTSGVVFHVMNFSAWV